MQGKKNGNLKMFFLYFLYTTEIVCTYIRVNSKIDFLSEWKIICSIPTRNNIVLFIHIDI